MIEGQYEARKLAQCILENDEILQGLTVEYFLGGVNITAKVTIWGYQEFKQVEKNAREEKQERACREIAREIGIRQGAQCAKAPEEMIVGPSCEKKEEQNDQTSRK